MARKRVKNADRSPPRPHFIREWRKFRGLTQERLAERLEMVAPTISQLETGKQGYTQATLEALAEALDTDPASLLIRNPLDPEGIWSVWEALPTADRARAIEVLKALRRTGTDGN